MDIGCASLVDIASLGGVGVVDTGIKHGVHDCSDRDGGEDGRFRE